MKIFKSESLNPYINLATEEYLLKNYEDVFYIWRNDKSIIIGVNQNAYSEVNLDYVQKHGIKVVRRLTGGGAVYHDAGNVNYTFIRHRGDGEEIDFARYTAPVISALKALGADASLSGRNDIMIGERKVSGSAQTVKDGKVLHHGCLLYSADLSYLASALKVNKDKLEGKGIKSVKSRVENIKSLTGCDMSPEEFADYLCLCAAKDGEEATLSEIELAEVERLAKEKYSTWEWNYGKFGELKNTVEKRFPFGKVCISYSLKDGIISELSISGDFFSVGNTEDIIAKLVGVRFDREEIALALDGIKIDRIISGSTQEDFLNLLFS